MKKTKFAILILASTIFFMGCESEGRYIDLESGNRVEVEKDSETGYMVNAETRKPLYIYVDTEANDTLYGRTGSVINGKVAQNGGKWEYDADGDFKYTDGDYKLKVEADGDYKIKDGDYKKKVDADGDIKIKDGDTKIKIDGKTGEKKVKND
ncbi:MAG: hypothetical protein H0V30_01525 [Chitinophagaceae bacterium]|jgi:hypothetical protein|nr:hypothetical protein [Chitinophagaceae bacterium]